MQPQKSSLACTSGHSVMISNDLRSGLLLVGSPFGRGHTDAAAEVLFGLHERPFGDDFQ
jgi:hypothetical protein